MATGTGTSWCWTGTIACCMNYSMPFYRWTALGQPAQELYSIWILMHFALRVGHQQMPLGFPYSLVW